MVFKQSFKIFKNPKNIKVKLEYLLYRSLYILFHYIFRLKQIKKVV